MKWTVFYREKRKEKNPQCGGAYCWYQEHTHTAIEKGATIIGEKTPWSTPKQSLPQKQ